MNDTLAVNSGKENSRGTLRTDLPSKTEGIVWCCLFAVLSVFIVVESLLTVFLFTFNKKLRKKSLFLVLNMAIADLIFGALALPLYIYLGFGRPEYYRIWTQNVNTSLNLFLDVTSKVTLVASLISVAFISCERFYAISQPFNHRTLTVRNYCTVILTVWILALPFSSLVFLIPGQECTYVGMPFAVILLFTICGCNIAVWRKLKQRSVDSHPQSRISRNERVTRTLLFVSTLALFCWLPFVISNGLRGLDVEIPWRHAMIVNFLNFSNSFVNPIVYALRIPEFRRALAVCCSTRDRKLNKENIETRNNKTDPLIPPTQPKSSKPDSSHPQPKFDDVNTDSKMMLTEEQELFSLLK
ncbi:adenosine receptor A3-like [Stylophora pistillata]|uniref:adenosine receptor A3-like n=1 Tax=Stylophora pistillata TaxID=50429 RepID=UPI000C04ED3E|nr:adenosine receptor A3-like [Stylophora pistillata]